MLLTVFTPTYNRGYTLDNLYHSLQKQTRFDFEWLIVDDGSTDNTEFLVAVWQNEGNPFQIRYIKTQNCGKSMAHNRGAAEARGDLFINVDSDDWLVASAVEVILDTWSSIKDSNISGMIAFRGFSDGAQRTIAGDAPSDIDTLLNFFTKSKLKGEMLFILVTDHLKMHMFPEFEDEKFVPDGYLYIDMFGNEEQLLLIRQVLYLSEYLDDGMTKSGFKNLTSSPLGYKAYCYKRIEWHKRFIDKFVDAIRLDAVLLFLSGKSKHEIFKSSLLLIAFPIGFAMYAKRFRKWKT